jgi:hypothetical protein
MDMRQNPVTAKICGFVPESADDYASIRRQKDTYGVALMMIAQGCNNPRGFAAEILKKSARSQLEKSSPEGADAVQSDQPLPDTKNIQGSDNV